MYKIFISRSKKKYLYDSISNNFFEIDDNDLLLLNSLEGETQELKSLGTEFWESVYGEDSLPILTEIPVIPSATLIPEILVLEMTQQCNFRCKYCIYSGTYKYERKHQNVNMSIDTVDKIIKSYFETEDTPAYVSLYGGEPLLQFPLIEYLVKRIEGTNNVPVYAMTTNGSLLLNERIAHFLVSNNFRLTVSFDGINHDLYRKTIHQEDTSELVIRGLEFLKSIDENYFKENVTISVTLSPPYLLAENAIYFNTHKLFSQTKLLINTVNYQDSNFFDGIDMHKERKKLSDDYSILAEEFIDMGTVGTPFHHALFTDALSRIDHRNMSLQSEAYPPGPCNPGINRLFITATGNKHICERVGNYGYLGNLDDSKMQIDLFLKVKNDFRNCISPHCKKCLYVRLCDACYSIFHENDKIGTPNRIISVCNEKRTWFEFMIYIFLSKKERELLIDQN